MSRYIQCRSECERRVFQMFCFCGLLGLLLHEWGVGLITCTMALLSASSWAGRCHEPSLSGQESPSDISSLISLWVQSGTREGLLINYCHWCCYQPLPWGWANGTSGTFSLNLDRGEMGGVRSLRREEAGGTGASSEGLWSAVGGGKWHSYTCWAILMHSRLLSITRLPKINGQSLDLSEGAFICLQLQLFLYCMATTPTFPSASAVFYPRSSWVRSWDLDRKTSPCLVKP